jgi:hypothetical protein
VKINYWKVSTITLLGFLLWLSYSGRSLAAQYGSIGETYKITKTFTSPSTVNVSGAVMGFSCTPDVEADLIKGDGIVSTQVNCYVLSK